MKKLKWVHQSEGGGACLLALFALFVCWSVALFVGWLVEGEGGA